MAVNIGDKIFISKPFPDVDSKYGPFSSVEEAWESIGPDGDDIACIGLTVGIQANPNEPIVDY